MNDKEYQTSDLIEICYLLAHSAPLTRTERDHDRVSFVFDDSDDRCASLSKEFRHGNDLASTSRIFTVRHLALNLIKNT